jgi:hypothetical protein
MWRVACRVTKRESAVQFLKSTTKRLETTLFYAPNVANLRREGSKNDDSEIVL